MLFAIIGIPHLQINTSKIKRLNHPVNNESEEQSDVLIARQLTRVSFGIHARNIDGKDKIFWNGAVLMALPGNEYGIPIPLRPAFGKQQFVVAFSESGALAKLRYASTSGAADASGLIGTIAGEIQGSSATEQANALKAEADLIKQRHRLANCRADPTTCS